MYVKALCSINFIFGLTPSFSQFRPSFREELEMPYLILLAVWSTAMYLRWATGTIQDFKEELGIYCLRIPGPGKEKT